MEAVKSAYTEVPNHDIVIGHLLKHGYKVARAELACVC
jgi:hypothetical protein